MRFSWSKRSSKGKAVRLQQEMTSSLRSHLHSLYWRGRSAARKGDAVLAGSIARQLLPCCASEAAAAASRRQQLAQLRHVLEIA